MNYRGPALNPTSPQDEQLIEIGGSPYESTAHGMIRKKLDRNRLERIPIANFKAQITREKILINGDERRRLFEITAVRGAETRTVTVAADRFEKMEWVIPELGAQFIIHAESQAKEHARAAIQYLSHSYPSIQVYVHTGWIKYNGKWLFLHAGGAIGPNIDANIGDRADDSGDSKPLPENSLKSDVPISPITASSLDSSTVHVELPPVLRRYRLPAAPPKEKIAPLIKYVLNVLFDAIPKKVLYPLFASVWRAAVDECDFAVYIVGPTGSGKSTLAGLITQFFGVGLDDRHLPGSWLSTTNSLLESMSAAANVVFPIDDFVPSGSAGDMAHANREADKVFRAQGNHAGRSRLSRNGTPQVGKASRSLVLGTGEVLPEGRSLEARMLVIELPLLAVTNAANIERLSKARKVANAGGFASLMTAFLSWLSSLRDDELKGMRRMREGLYETFNTDGQHPRLINIAAELQAGFEVFLNFAMENGAISEVEFDKYWDEIHEVLLDHITRQQRSTYLETPARRFLQLVNTALLTGRGYLANAQNEVPADEPQRWGWTKFSTFREVKSPEGTIEEKEFPSYRHRGEHIGWIDSEFVYLDIDKSLGTAQRLIRESNLQTLMLTSRTLGRQLDDCQLLAGKDKDRYTVKITVLGDSVRVLKLLRSTLPNGPYLEEPADESSTAEKPLDMESLLDC